MVQARLQVFLSLIHTATTKKQVLFFYILGQRSNIAKGLAVGDGNVAVFIETGSLSF